MIKNPEVPNVNTEKEIVKNVDEPFALNRKITMCQKLPINLPPLRRRVDVTKCCVNTLFCLVQICA